MALKVFTIVILTCMPIQDPEKIKARAARFGIDVAKQSAGSKRTAPTEEIDPEEAERRRKRAERFGLKA